MEICAVDIEDTYSTFHVGGAKQYTFDGRTLWDGPYRSFLSLTLLRFSIPGLTEQQIKLGDAPAMFSLIPLAQTSRAPIQDLGAEDGLVGNQFVQARNYADFFGNVAARLAINIHDGVLE